MIPPLGFIVPADRTQEQGDAHASAEAKVLRQFALPAPTLAKGEKVVLTDLWTHPDVVADVGRRIMRELQNTGSCVNVGGRNALACTIAAQRVAAENPTKAFEPFTWHNYAMSRHAMGDDGRGEGSLGSTFAQSLHDDGVDEWPIDPNDTLPDYRINGDHINITSTEEMEWSSYRNPKLQAVLARAKAHRLGSAARLQDPNGIKAANLNAYGVSFACNNFIGNASVKGSGSDAYVRGRWDGRGGHQQWVFGYWEHPTDGPLYAVGNNWADETYPKDPAGLPLCCCWVAEADVAAAFRMDAEVYAFSMLDYFPAQPKLLDWLI